MTEGLADTSVFVALELGRSIRSARLPDVLAISVITLAELRAGVLASRDLETRNRRLTTFTRVLALKVFPVDEDVAEAWAHLRISLRDSQLRMPISDSWIAATALAHGVPLVTLDRDYDVVPGLNVIDL